MSCVGLATIALGAFVAACSGGGVQGEYLGKDVARLLYMINRAAGNVGVSREVSSFVQEFVSLGSGGYVLLIAGAFLAYHPRKSKL